MDDVRPARGRLAPAAVHIAVTSPNYVGNRVAAFSREDRSGGGRGPMALGRIRVAMSDDPRSQELLTEALAGQRVCSRLMCPRDTQMTVDVVVEPADVDGLGALLAQLHMISPQVFVSRADQPSSLATA